VCVCARARFCTSSFVGVSGCVYVGRTPHARVCVMGPSARKIIILMISYGDCNRCPRLSQRDRDEARMASAADMIEEMRAQARDLRGLYSVRLKQASRLTVRRAARPGSPILLRQPDCVRRVQSSPRGCGRFAEVGGHEKDPEVGTFKNVFLTRLNLGVGLVQKEPQEVRG
jgi:hypothetical protein